MRVIALVLAACACVAPRHSLRSRVPEADSDAFEACRPILYERVCAHGDADPFAVAAAGCLGALTDRFIALPSAEDRRDYLVELGCPTPLVRQHLP